MIDAQKKAERFNKRNPTPILSNWKLPSNPFLWQKEIQIGSDSQKSLLEKLKRWPYNTVEMEPSAKRILNHKNFLYLPKKEIFNYCVIEPSKDLGLDFYSMPFGHISIENMLKRAKECGLGLCPPELIFHLATYSYGDNVSDINLAMRPISDGFFALHNDKTTISRNMVCGKDYTNSLDKGWEKGQQLWVFQKKN